MNHDKPICDIPGCGRKALSTSIFCSDHDDKPSNQSIFSAEEYKALSKKRGKSQRKEESIQLAVCNYLRAKYPDVIWFCDLSSGMKLPIWIAAKNKKMRSHRGLPDLYILRPRYVKGKRRTMVSGFTEEYTLMYHGLCIELKKDDVRLKTGGIAKSDHHDEQADILARLNQLQFKAVFACGLEEAIKVIDEYLG